MEPGSATEGAGGGTTRMMWPLIGSAAGHIALLAFLLLLRSAAGPAFPRVVQVVLVEGSRDIDPAGVLTALVPSRRPPPIEVKAGAPPVQDVTPPVVHPAVAALPSATVARAETTVVRAGGNVPSATGAGAYRGSLPGAAKDPAGPVSGAAGVREAHVAPAPAGRAKTASAPVAGVSGGSGAGEGREIHLLRERIESRIVYPEEAVRRGQEGEVLLRIRVGEGGIPGEIRIARSSGTRALDDAARNGVVRAAPLPSLPGWFEIPVRFFLR